ncbi:hypothetical protein [Pseudomonas faucium]|uniref:hypothetical protein n=1 Tax=Pseudomonas faucium TaxID=2740518 RepID=UPI001596DFE9|nr:hypothetical protein [Pseudomonas faucium]
MNLSPIQRIYCLKGIEGSRVGIPALGRTKSTGPWLAATEKEVLEDFRALFVSVSCGTTGHDRAVAGETGK